MSTKERIIDSAIELFSDKGFTETSVKEIAKASGIRPSSLYNHYASKLEILEALLQIYIEYTNKHSLSKETIEARAEKEDPKTLIKSLFYRYDKNEAQKYTKILKIIFHEQYRNEKVGDFVRNYMIKEIESDIDYLLVKLIEKGRIAPINHRYYAKILNDLCLASGVEFSHFSNTKAYRQQKDRITMDNILEFVIDIIIQDDGNKYVGYFPGQNLWLKAGSQFHG